MSFKKVQAVWYIDPVDELVGVECGIGNRGSFEACRYVPMWRVLSLTVDTCSLMLATPTLRDPSQVPLQSRARLGHPTPVTMQRQTPYRAAYGAVAPEYDRALRVDSDGRHPGCVTISPYSRTTGCLYGHTIGNVSCKRHLEQNEAVHRQPGGLAVSAAPCLEVELPLQDGAVAGRTLTGGTAQSSAGTARVPPGSQAAHDLPV